MTACCSTFENGVERQFNRAGVVIENGIRRLTRNPFRTFVHPAAQMEEIIKRAGFDLSSRSETWM
jgi:hypothetical protein